MASRYFYQSEVRHSGLNKYRVVKAESKYELDQKVSALIAQWNEQWEKKCAVEEKRIRREQLLSDVEESVSYANELTVDAEKIQQELENILQKNFSPAPLNINKLKDHAPFAIEKPDEPILEIIPVEPFTSDIKYNPKVPFFTKISSKKFEEFKNRLAETYKDDHEKWENNRNKALAVNIEIKSKYEEEVKLWETEKNLFILAKEEKNREIDQFILNYKNGDVDAIAKYYSLAINEIELPFEFDKQIVTEYTADNKMLVIDFMLPTIDLLPQLKKVTYVKARNEFKETFQTESYMKKKYDQVIYQLVLTILNYIYLLDKPYQFINSIVINGMVSTIDKATGKNIEPYILSINVSKVDFEQLLLTSIDPIVWFKSAKGVSAAAIANITPVAPIINISHEDKRFVDGYNVTENLDSGINLAAIDWQDFENLIRELFEKEFNTTGGEVKITQASRDGGVDAVAFDPDPIRGGKIVIQAKRYTNVVGVSAVRDLYGTVMNEGATKGILVTTSNYGNDAYHFAKGKPLTLLNGANLLFLLEKHGHQARIDLKEAKTMINNGDSVTLSNRCTLNMLNVDMAQS